MKLWVLFGIMLLIAHPFHLSVTEIFHNEEQELLEISLKLFVDDLEEGLEKAGYGKLYLDTPEEDAKSPIFLYDYLLNNMEINLDSTRVEVTYVGKEYESGNVMWVYLKLDNVKDFSSISVRNHILTEVFEDQQNIVHIKKGGKTRSLRLRKGKDKGKLEF